MKQKGFQIVEMAAIITILGLILIITFPKYQDALAKSKRDYFATNAKLVLKTIEYQKALGEDIDFDKIDLNTLKKQNIEIKDYQAIKVTLLDDKLYILLEGKNEWKDIYACGDIQNMQVFLPEEALVCQISFAKD